MKIKKIILTDEDVLRCWIAIKDAKNPLFKKTATKLNILYYNGGRLSKKLRNGMRGK